jgi:hypothetical protein
MGAAGVLNGEVMGNAGMKKESNRPETRKIRLSWKYVSRFRKSS